MKGKPLSDVSKVCVSKVTEIWDLAKIPTINLNNSRVKLEKMFNNWRFLQKNMKKTTVKEKENREIFCQELCLLFDIASGDWEKKIKNDRLKNSEEKNEDLDFLVDQRTLRKMFLGSFSKHYSEAVEKKLEREQSEKIRTEKEIQRMEAEKEENRKMKAEFVDSDASDNSDSENVDVFKNLSKQKK